MEPWKQQLADKALQLGLLKDPQWVNRLDEPMPLWVMLEIVMRLKDALEPPYASYD
jgi:hypothetical protein